MFVLHAQRKPLEIHGMVKHAFEASGHLRGWQKGFGADGIVIGIPSASSRVVPAEMLYSL